MIGTDNDETQAIVEIKAMSAGARRHLQHKIRNHMQIISWHSEEPMDHFLPHPAQERFKAIQEAITVMSEDMRRIGL